MADLVRRRNHYPMRRSHQHDGGPRVEYLAFRLAGDCYAAPVALIREILKPPPITEVPRAPATVRGIVSVRGQLVTVIDLRRRLRLAEPPATRKSRILLSESEAHETLGLFVDEVLQVHRFAEHEIEHAAPALGGEVADFIAGIARPSAPAPIEPTRAAAELPAFGASRARSHARAARAAVPVAQADMFIVLLDLRSILASPGRA